MVGYWYVLQVPHIVINKLNRYDYSVFSERFYGAKYNKIKNYIRCELLVNEIQEVNFNWVSIKEKMLGYSIVFNGEADSYVEMNIAYEDYSWKILSLNFLLFHDKECRLQK